MATTICAELTEGFDLSCVRNIPKKYVQELVLININDIDRTASVVGNQLAGCDYTVQLTLKQGKKGVLIKLPETGNAIKGFTAKSKTDNGFVEYLHQVQTLVVGVDKETKCKLDKLDHGRYVAVTKTTNGIIEVHGFENGLSTGDYTYDLVEGGGGSLIVLQSDETAKESMLPLIFKPQGGGDGSADFDSLFENVA